MSKYLRTLLVALLVVSLAVTGAMATEEFPKAARELIWVAGASTVTANPDTGELVIRDKSGKIVTYRGGDVFDGDEYSGVIIIDPYNNNSTLGKILNNVFFVDTATEAADTYEMRRLGAYAFKFRGSDLPQAFISYNEDSHRYWIPQKLYDVEWKVVTDDEDFNISFDVDPEGDSDSFQIVISGIYPNPVSKDYKITLVGTPYLTSVGEKYYTFDYLKDAMANFPLEWSMTVHVFNDGRVVLTPESSDISGTNVFTRIVSPASGVKIHEVSMNDANYKVTIKNDQFQDFHVAGGTVRHTYRVSLYPGDYVLNYAYIISVAGVAEENVDDDDLADYLMYTLVAGKTYYTPASSLPRDKTDEEYTPVAGTYLIPLYTTSDCDGDIAAFVPMTVAYNEDDEEWTYTIGELESGIDYVFDADECTLEFPAETYVYGGMLDFDPSKIASDPDNDGAYVYSDDNQASFDVQLYTDVADDFSGSNIRGFAISYTPNEDDVATNEYPVYATAPFIYDGVYFPEGLVLVANYGAEVYAANTFDSGDEESPTTITKGKSLAKTRAAASFVMEDYYDVIKFVNALNNNNNKYNTPEELTAFLAAAPLSDTKLAALLEALDASVTDHLDDGSEAALALYVDNYVLSYDKEVAEKYVRGVKAGKVMRVTVPLVTVINDAFDDIIRTPLGRTLASGYILQWDVIFSGDVEEEDEPVTPVTPVIAISGDTTVTNGVVGTGYNFVLSYDTDLFGYTLDPEDAEYVEEGIDEDGNEIITITPTGTGNFSVKVTPYDLASKDNKGSAVTLTVTVPLPGQLAATFNPATVTVKAGETATSTLEIVNATTGSPAVAGVSPSADWVTYEPRFINGGAFYEFKFAPAATMTAGTHQFTVTVSDDDKTTQAVVTVNVTAAGGDDPTPGTTPAAPTATDLSTFQANLTDSTTTSASVVVAAPSGVTVSSWKVYDNGTEVTDTSKVVITNNLPNQSARITVYPDAFDAGEHTLTARYVTTDSTTSNALTLGSFTVEDVPVVPVVGKSGGGGCDAGFGALALAAVSLFLLKKRS
ncbi:MAG: hypothetical protein IJS99_04130 [Synergistaceae bacterium]|nr:hypothetical protein [Synergistaceae bacterium]